MRSLAKELGYEPIVPPIDFVSGTTTENFINAEMKLNVFFVALNVLGKFLLDMISWMFYIQVLYCL